MTRRPDSIPAPILELLAVFAEDPALRFGDLDSAALEALADDVRARDEAVAAAEAALKEARGALEEAQAALAKRAAQGLQYASVYAADDEALSARLSAIRLPAARATKKATRKPRKKREVAAEAAETSAAVVEQAAA